jgi:hypothetical protein
MTHPLKKFKRRRAVKEKERAARDLNENLRDCEDVSNVILCTVA